MQSGIREYAGKNKYWTPSNIGITGSMINNAINNLDMTKYYHTFVYTSEGKYNDQYIYVNNIKARTAGSVLTVDIPESIKGNLTYVSVNFTMNSHYKFENELGQLCCRLSPVADTSTNQGPVVQSVRMGPDSFHFSLNEFFVKLPENKVYLQFMFNNNNDITKTDSEMKNGIYIYNTDYKYNTELTVVGI